MPEEATDTQSTGLKWRLLAALGVLSVYVYVFMEWLFFATKPSFMSALDVPSSLLILFGAPLPISLAGSAAVLACWGASLVISDPNYQKAWMGIARLVPVFILSCSALLLTDNFTNTVLGFGISSTRGAWSLLYALLFLLFFTFIYRFVWKFEKNVRHERRIIGVTLGVFGISFLGVVLSLGSADRIQSGVNPMGRTSGQLPNIILLSSDGLNAGNMSVYGYERETTPFLEEFARDALVCENAFSNSAHTGSSIASVLTGKIPTEIRLIFPPEILRGRDAYQHLPLLLRNYGYHSIHLSMRHYADVYDLNMRESFDSANFRERVEFQASQFMSAIVGQESAYFLDQLRDRLESRVLHAFFYREMENVYDEVVENAGARYWRDSTLSKELSSFIERTPSPFFAHVHLMGTHGRRFRPKEPHFSEGKTQDGDWMPDFYDDAIRDFDRHCRKIVEQLQARKQLQDTLIIIHTDHAQRYRTDQRVPLILRFPGGKPWGRISENVQNLDIAPTVLDYLHVNIPDWMKGRSLISSPLDSLHPILSVRRRPGATVKCGRLFEIDAAKTPPPFYSLGMVRAIICHKSFRLSLRNRVMEVSSIEGHTVPCPETELPDPAEVEQLILSHLAQVGYDVSSFSAPVPERILD